MEKVARTIAETYGGTRFRNLSNNCLGYTDDIDIITEDIRDTERIVIEIKEATDKVGLTFNDGKTKIMEVAKESQFQGQMNLDNMIIEVEDKFKYLGMTNKRWKNE